MIWLMNGTSIIGAGALANPGPSWHVAGTGDFNGDGKADILWQNSDGTPVIWLMNGASIIGSGIAGGLSCCDFGYPRCKSGYR